MERLIEGFYRFRETYWRDHRELFHALVSQGQSPGAMVIACSDSRVDPQLIFGAGPGEIFVVRNVANLVPPYAPNADYHGTSAALEFAVRSLHVRHVIVLGHARCGGVAALLGAGAGQPAGGDFITAWMAIARPARESALACAGGSPEAAQRACEQETVKVSLANLKTFPWIAERVADGSLLLHGLYFDIEVGDLLRLGPDGGFAPV